MFFNKPRSRITEEFKMDEVGYYVFKELYDNPLSSLRSISRKINVSYDSVRRRYLYMKENGFLASERTIFDEVLGERILSEVRSFYNPASLDLKRYLVIVKKVLGKEELHDIKKLFSFFPYTHRIIEIVGETLNVLVEVDIPKNSENNLLSFLIEARNYGLYGEIEVITPSKLIFVPHNFDYIWHNLNTSFFTGSFPPELNRFFRKNNTFWNVFLGRGNPRSSRDRELDFNRSFHYKLIKEDLYILRELMLNPKTSLSFLSATYSKEPSYMSQKVKRIFSRHIWKTFLEYDRSHFQLYDRSVLFGEFSNTEKMQKFEEIISAMPFETFAYMEKKWFLVIIESHPLFIIDFMSFMWNDFRNLLSYRCLPHTELLFPVDPRNYDEKNEAWISSREKLVDQPFELFESSFSF